MREELKDPLLEAQISMAGIIAKERQRLWDLGITATDKQLYKHLETTLETYEDEYISPAPDFCKPGYFERMLKR